MDQPHKAPARAGIPAQPAIDELAKTAITESQLASEVVLFLHAGGLPDEAIAHQLASLQCFGKPRAYFDLDGPMWLGVRASEARGFADYLKGLIDWTVNESGILSALIDYRDLLWLEQRRIFQEQLRQRLRIVRFAFLDPALQAYRCSMVARSRREVRSQSEASPTGDAGPGFVDLARQLIEIEQAEDLGDMFCKRHGLPAVKLWIEDLARPGVPALRGLLARWSIAVPEQGCIVPIEPPSASELETVAAFRTEASRRHWSHALLPKQS